MTHTGRTLHTAAAEAPPAVGRPNPKPVGAYEWVYLWGWPIRAMHWAAALSIVFLVISGLYIGRPYFVGPADGVPGLIMTRMRFVHFLAAAVFVMTGIIRVYWLIAGNKFERFPALFPVRPRDWKNMIRQVQHYLMVERTHPPRYLGHNPLQQLSYTGVYVMGALMVVTGFALYAQYDPGGVLFTMFNWVNTVMGGNQITRFVHHVLTWCFLIFIPIHVYLAVRIDVMDREAGISSIISGGRFVEKDVEFEDA